MVLTGVYMSVMWKREGVVISGHAVNDESNAQEPNIVIDGSTFKLWWTGGWDTPHINYSTSSDGITWTGGSSVLDSYMHAFVTKISSTYYLYAVPTATTTQIDRYTSSDGTTWNLDQANTIGVGGVGTWDANRMGNNFVWQESANDWRMIYEARDTDVGVWKLGYATSTDGKSWSKSGSNPVISETGSIGGPFVYKDTNGTYWLWAHHATTGFLPTDLERYKSTNLTSWTKTPLNKDILKRLTADEGVNTVVGQVADPTIAQYNYVTYMWYGANADGSAESGHSNIKLVKSPMTLEKLILTEEGI